LDEDWRNGVLTLRAATKEEQNSVLFKKSEGVRTPVREKGVVRLMGEEAGGMGGN